ncbi:F0F1 ATP synthase subunit epsilon [Vulgatibacter sp.]|uniref:F0F1 ATP synthase subunit epsilon n=1 Tax=Vulgatibacter sp. TaxID=1971226 RepID=UPI003563FE4B
MPIQLEIVTPEKRLLSQSVDSVKAPGMDGSFGVLPGHTPYVAALQPGSLTLIQGNREQHYFIGGGFAQVQGDRVIILAESAESAEEIDVERAERALTESQARLKSLREEEELFQVERARVQRATARITMARKR